MHLRERLATLIARWRLWSAILLFLLIGYILTRILYDPYTSVYNHVLPEGVSPDGQYMVVKRIKANSHADRFMLHVKSGDSWQMHRGNGWQITPDSQQVVFIEGRKHIAIANTDGSNHHRVATCDRLCSAPRWSSDFQSIIFYNIHGCCMTPPNTKRASINGNYVETIDDSPERIERIKSTLNHVENFYQIEPTTTQLGRIYGFNILDPDNGDLIRQVTFRSIFRVQFPLGIRLTVFQALIFAFFALILAVFLLWGFFHKPTDHRADVWVVILALILLNAANIGAYLAPNFIN